MPTAIAALEAARVTFVEENGEGPGVRPKEGGAAAIPVEDLNACCDVRSP
jgi:hypothetical protein